MPVTTASTSPILSSLLRAVAFTACVLVALSFGLFCVDQFSTASAHQQRELSTNLVAPLQAGHQHHGGVRGAIDDAAASLESPFDSIATGNGAWPEHAVPAGLALLLYGFGLGFLARYASGRA